MIKRFYLVTVTILVLAHTACSQTDNQWRIADQQVVRISPIAFPQLPTNITSFLQKRGCSIPQTYVSIQPHNVISGEFRRKGQIDWAVVCSKDYTSSILIFWGGSDKRVTEIEKTPDQQWLQGIGNEQIGFSISISPVGKDFILRHYKLYGGSKPPVITHQGINESFLEKASTVHYYDRGKWLKFTGAD